MKGNLDKQVLKGIYIEIGRQLQENKFSPILILTNPKNVTPYLLEWLKEQVDNLTDIDKYLDLEQRLKNRLRLFIMHEQKGVTEKMYREEIEIEKRYGLYPEDLCAYSNFFCLPD